MRSLLLSFFFSLSLLACGGSPDPDAQAPFVDDARLPPPRTADDTPTIPAPPPSTQAPSTAKDIAGTVTDNAGNPIADVSITLLDAKGRKTETKTDASGAFDAAAVVAPYDLHASKGYSLVFFGLTTTSPQLKHAGSTKPPAYTSHQGKLMTAVDFPTCPTTSCVAQLWSGSKTGGLGRKSLTFSGAAHRSDIIEIEHAWTNNATKDTVDVDVLLSDSSFTKFWHQKLQTDGVVKENETALLYAAAPAPVPSVGPISIEVDAPTIPADWRKDVQVFLNVPGQHAAFYMHRTDAASLVTYLPDIAGAEYSVLSWRGATPVDDPTTGYHLHDERSGAVTKLLPVSKAPVDIQMTKGPAILAPKTLASIPRAGGKLEWEPAAGRAMEVSVWDVDGSKQAFVAYTTGASVSVGRLNELGIVLTDGRHLLNLGTRPAATVEDALSPAYWAWNGSSWTEESVAFDVVP